VAISYLQRHAWTTHEAVLMLNLIDPRCYVFYEGNGKKKHGNVSTYFEGMVLFNPDRKNLKVSDWLAWASKGTEKVPRRTPLSYATQFLKFIESNDPRSLIGLSSRIDEEIDELHPLKSIDSLTVEASDRQVVARNNKAEQIHVPPTDQESSAAQKVLSRRFAYSLRDRRKWSEDELRAVLVVIKKHGSIRKAAKFVGCSSSTLSEKKIIAEALTH
jgi:hypothetical protein